MTLLSIRGLVRRFGDVAALDGVTLDVAAGEFVALLGGSGSGKSTLLRVVAGFERADAGAVTLDGADLLGIPPHRRPLNMMFQSYALFPHMTAFDNVAYGLRREGAARAEVTRRVGDVLAMLGLDGLGARKPHALSGGQRQRVALARALVKRPRLLLLDEPLGALDAGLRERTGFELRAIQRDGGAAFVMVTHDQGEALALADRVMVLDRGRVVQEGTPREVWERPATRFVAGFLGGANVIEGRVVDGALVAPGLILRATVPIGTATAAALRPDRVRVVADAPAENGATGTVEDAAFRGEGTVLVVRLAGGATLRAVLPDAPAPARGDTVSLAWDAGAVVPLRD